MGTPDPQSITNATPTRCHSCMITNKIKRHQAERKEANAVKHVVSASRIDTRLLRMLPASKSGLVGKRRKLWTGFKKSNVFIEIKSSHALIFNPRVTTQTQADDAVPHKVYALRGASVIVNDTPTNSLFAFSILFADGKERGFVVKTQQEREEWTQAITAAAAGPCFGDLRKVARLGAGHFGKVFLAVHKPTGSLVAMKQVDRKGGKQTRMIHERAVVQRITEIGSQFLSRTVLALREPTSGDLIYVNELHTGGDLWGLIRQVHRVDADTVRFIASEVALGIQHLHEHGIMHRDIKLENIMLDSSGHMKLIDFGLSMVLKPVEITEEMMAGSRLSSKIAMAPMFQRTFSVCGTNYYMPPEMLTGGHGHGLSLDWWQLGCLVYELFVGRPAFFEVGAAKIHAKILAGPPAFPPQEKIDIPQDAKEFILGLLKHDSTMRLGASGVESVQFHSFFKSMNWSEAENGELEVPQVLMKHVSANATKTSELDFAAEAAALLIMHADESSGSGSIESKKSDSSESKWIESSQMATSSSSSGSQKHGQQQKQLSSSSSSSSSSGDTIDKALDTVLDMVSLRNNEIKRHSTQTPSSWRALDQLVSHFPDATDLDGGKFSVIDGARKLSEGADCDDEHDDDDVSSSRSSNESSVGCNGKINSRKSKKINRVSSCPDYHALSTTAKNILLPNDAYLGFDYLADMDVLAACVAETKAIGIVPHAGVHKRMSNSRMHSSASSVSAHSHGGL